jgi:biotin operon repressor
MTVFHGKADRMDINKKEKHMAILDALTDAMGRSEGQSPEEIKQELREEGIDVDSAMDQLKRIQQNISMAAKRHALKSAREKRLDLEKKHHEIIGKFKNWSRDEILKRIKELIESSGTIVGMAHRDLESSDTEDILSLLEDLEMAHYRRDQEKESDGE